MITDRIRLHIISPSTLFIVIFVIVIVIVTTTATATVIVAVTVIVIIIVIVVINLSFTLSGSNRYVERFLCVLLALNLLLFNSHGQGRSKKNNREFKKRCTGKGNFAKQTFLCT